MKIKKYLFVALIIISTSFFVNQVVAHPPENIDLSYNISTQVLTVTITHNTANLNSHYVDKVEVYKNDVSIIEKDYTSQPSNTFTLTFNFQAFVGDIIKVEAECNQVGKTEETITVTDNTQNNPPTKPIIQGQTKGKTGTLYEYSFYSTDPDGDNLSYCIDWGDNSGEVCIGPFPSGIEQKSSHSWDEEDTYLIRAKARDINGAESDWTTLEVNMPKIYIHNPTIQLFMKIFNRFLIFEKILNQII